jgi:hypothetical protein
MLSKRKFGAAITLMFGLALPSVGTAAYITTNEAEMDATFSQGTLSIDIRFNPTQYINDASYLVIDSVLELSTFTAQIQLEASPIVNMAFIDTLNVCGSTLANFGGCAALPGNWIVMDSSQAGAGGGYGGNLNSHELGHNLGLTHTAIIGRLMDPTITGTLLTAAEIATILASPLIQTDGGGDFISITPILVIPEPTSLTLLVLGLVVLSRTGRR